MGTPWDFKFDKDSDDLMLDSNYQLAVTETFADIVALRIRTRLRTILGEHFLNRNLGVAYFEEIMVKNPDLSKVKNLLLVALSGVEGVSKVLQFDPIFESSTRTYRVTFKVLATTGEVVEGEV